MRTRSKDAIPIELDRLATTVLGALRYLPSSVWVEPFVRALQQWNPALANDWELDVQPTVELWPLFLVPSHLVRHLGMLPRQRGGRRLTKGFVSPDAIVSCAEWTLVISVQGDEEIPAERLFQDYVLARSLRNDDRFAVVHIDTSATRRLRAGIRFRAPRRGDREVRPEDPLSRYVAVRSERIDGIAIDDAFADARLAWLGWSALHTLLSEIDTSGLDPELGGVIERARADALSLLEESDMLAPSYDIGELASLTIDPASLPSYGDETLEAREVPVAVYEPGDATARSTPAHTAPEADDGSNASEQPTTEETAAATEAPSTEPGDDDAVEVASAPVEEPGRGIGFDTGGGAADEWRRAPATSSADYGPDVLGSSSEPEQEEQESPLTERMGLIDELSALTIEANAIPYFPRPAP